MLDRRFRLAGVQRIEAALFKHAQALAPAPFDPKLLAVLKAQRDRERNATSSMTATATVPKIVTAPTT